jgi:hypothetical protein
MQEKDKKRYAMEMEACQNAFLIFLEHNRERIMEENACLGLHDISNKCGEEWAALGATNKKRYEFTNPEDVEGYNNDTDEIEKVEGNRTI